MSIRIYTPEDVRDLPKPVTLWAVWEGTEGEHHERAFTYVDERETYPTMGGGSITLYRKHPLLTDDYEEEPKQVLPGTLRFIRIEDLYNVTRICDSAGRVYALSRPAYTYDSGRVVSSETFNGMCIEVHGSYTLLKARSGYEA